MALTRTIGRGGEKVVGKRGNLGRLGRGRARAKHSIDMTGPPDLAGSLVQTPKDGAIGNPKPEKATHKGRKAKMGMVQNWVTIL